MRILLYCGILYITNQPRGETTMTVKEFLEIIEQMKNDESLNDYWVAGVRFEDKERQVGEVIEECSKHNIDRDDERDFPEFGTEEYEDMFELDGASAWDINDASQTLKPPSIFLDDDVSEHFLSKHCYLIVGDNTANEGDALDDGEVVIVEPKVLKVIY